MRKALSKSPSITWMIPVPRWVRIRRPLGRAAWDPDISLASVWIRSYQVAPYLQERNYHTSFNQLDPLPDVAIFLRRYDAADVQLARKLKASGVKIVLDTVVNYFQVRKNTTYGYGGASQERVENFHRLIELADQVWAASPFLQKLAAKRHPNAHFISDSVDPKHFQPQEKPPDNRNKTMRLGWAGTASKAHTLEEISPVLIDLINSKHVKISIFSQKRPELSLPFTFHPWRYSTFPKNIAHCDLCIAPRIVDNDYDRGHSLFKIGVFMAMGVPALAGPVPSYRLLLGDGLAGSICITEDEWRHSLLNFIANIHARVSASQNAITKMQPYLTPVISAQIDNLLQG